MTENLVDQTISADQTATTTERPAVPEGSVYLADVLAAVRKHARDNSWCDDAEYVTKEALNEGLTFKPAGNACGDRFCNACYGNDAVAVERFTPVEETDPFVTKARLKAAIKKAIYLGYDGSGPHRLYRELVDIYDLDEVVLPVLTYSVTFTVTEAGLRGRTVDESGVAYALLGGDTTGFTVVTESTEQATPTLTS
ncbi:hypothetical protein [Actinoplanes sp. NPDC051859]|uniref:hypothetical protein n=1 Tax=Actinoplanes sp. NPDC051859 TaxID=3363909 RepID=UPI00378F8403